MNEKMQALALAHRVLDRPSGDPDDDLAILARQFLRLREIVQARVIYEKPLGPGLHHITDVKLAEYLRDSDPGRPVPPHGSGP